MMLEQLPVAPDAGDADAKTYRTHRVSRDLQSLVSGKSDVSRATTPRPTDRRRRSGARGKKQWLKQNAEGQRRHIQAADLAHADGRAGRSCARPTTTPTSAVSAWERDDFFAWLKQQGLDKRHFYIVCGDRHWQYHAVDSTGIEEFSCGALVDANSRLGRKPGDPKSTDPDGKVKQPYYQTPRSGGFLIIAQQPAGEGRPAVLTFTWHDERGKQLHRCVKQAQP